MTRSLVTGGAGFIGSHIVDRLVGLGHEVVVIDNERAESNDQFYWRPDTVNYAIDIRDYKKLENFMMELIMFFTLQQSLEFNLLF